MTLIDRNATVVPTASEPSGTRLPQMIATATFSGAALVMGVLEARLPLGPGNSAVHHGYPFFAVAVAVVLSAVSGRSRCTAQRWSGLVGALGVAYALNALLIAVLSYAVTPEGAALPLGLCGWLADVFYPVCDVGLLGLMVGLLPGCRPQGGHRLAIGALLSLTGATMLCEALVPHTLDSTQVANPLGIHLLTPLSGVLQVLIPFMFVFAVTLSVVRGVQIARESRARDPQVARAALGSGLVLLLTFIGQAAVSESSWYAAGSIVLAGSLVACLLALRVATAETVVAAQMQRSPETARTSSRAA